MTDQIAAAITATISSQNVWTQNISGSPPLKSLTPGVTPNTRPAVQTVTSRSGQSRPRPR